VNQPDHWLMSYDDTTKKRIWIRLHHAPRQALYCPTGLEFGGPDPQQLQNNRETRILMTDGSYEVIRDD